MKKMFFMLLSSVLCILAVTSSVLASPSNRSGSTFDIVAAKRALATAHQSEYATNLTANQRQVHRDQVSKILLKMTAEGKSVAEISAAVKPYHTYILNQPQQSSFSPFSQQSDISMIAPIISFDSTNQEWSVTGAGHWDNANWLQDVDSLPTSVGSTVNVGGSNTVGIAYYNTNETYNTGVIQQTGYWTSRDEYITPVTTHSAAGGNGENGIYFEWQDYIRCDDYNIWTGQGLYSYLGDAFSADIVYNSDFEDYNGNAVTLYGHTWNQTTVSSVTLDVSAAPGFEINFSATTNRFRAQSTDSLF